MIKTLTTIIVTPEDLAWARGAALAAKRLFPGFCREGVSFGCDRNRTPWEESSLPQVVVARHWLEIQDHTKTPIRNSYNLKHYAENWAGFYVSNAALIAAAAGLGVNQKLQDQTSPNTLVAISKRFLPNYGEHDQRQVTSVIIETP